MPKWNPVSRLDKLAPGGIGTGLICLYHSANIEDYLEWRTNGEYGEDIFYYFFIPPQFLFANEGPNIFIYNDPLEKVKKAESVTGKTPTENGLQDLQNGKTHEFWHYNVSGFDKVTMQTHKTTKLPYLQVPKKGLGIYEEKRYFIPVPEVV